MGSKQWVVGRWAATADREKGGVLQGAEGRFRADNHPGA